MFRYNKTSQKLEWKINFRGVFMYKYSEEFKIKLVNEYLHGYLGYKLLAKK